MKNKNTILTAKNIGKEITTELSWHRCNDPYPIYKSRTYKCKSCLKEYTETAKDNITEIQEPDLCKECGSTTFKEVPEKATYKDIQKITTNIPKESCCILILEDDQCFYGPFEKEYYTVTGTLRVTDNGFKHLMYVIDNVTDMR